MNGEQLREWREQQGLKQRDVADLLNEPLGRKYTGNVVSVWERGDRPIPSDVLEFLTTGGSAPVKPEAMTEEGHVTTHDPAPPASGDVPPLAPTTAGKPSLALVAHDPALAKACEELWDMFGFSLVAIGSGFDKPAIRNDGQIICGWEDSGGKHPGMKRDLGVAYGKLAERNRTFQRIVLALSQESVWAEVTVVTTKLCIAMYQNHVHVAQVLAERERAARVEAAQPQYEEAA